MNFAKILDAVEHLVDAVEGLQHEGPAGPKILAAIAETRAAIADAKAP